MIVTFDWKKLTAHKPCGNLLSLPAKCDVRNEMNGRRNPDQVVLTAPIRGEKKPYQPRQFPGGIFKITEIVYTDDPDFAPVIIKTDATRPVFIWELDENGLYKNVTEEIQIDGGYWIHYNVNSKTSWGCIRPDLPADILLLARILETELDAGNPAFVEVL